MKLIVENPFMCEVNMVRLKIADFTQLDGTFSRKILLLRNS